MKLPTISKESQKGFTLVELIIVIVVIGILAAIILIAYGNVTSRANASAAKSNASAVLNYAEVYHADGNATSAYPTLTGTAPNQVMPTTESAKMPAGIKFITAAPSSSTDKDTIMYVKKADTGVCVGYYDQQAGSAKYMYGGDATSYASSTCS